MIHSILSKTTQSS